MKEKWDIELRKYLCPTMNTAKRFTNPKCIHSHTTLTCMWTLTIPGPALEISDVNPDDDKTQTSHCSCTSINGCSFGWLFGGIDRSTAKVIGHSSISYYDVEQHMKETGPQQPKLFETSRSD